MTDWYGITKTDWQNNRTSFAKAMRQLREERNITQEELGRRIGFGRTMVYNLENGKLLYPPSVNRICAVAKVLVPEGVERNWFIKLSGAKQQNDGTVNDAAIVAFLKGDDKYSDGSVAGWIRERRMAAGMSQTVLAQKVGVSQKTISDYEIGKKYPDGATYNKIIKATVVSSGIQFQRGDLSDLMVNKFGSTGFGSTGATYPKPPLIDNAEFVPEEAKAEDKPKSPITRDEVLELLKVVDRMDVVGRDIHELQMALARIISMQDDIRRIEKQVADMDRVTNQALHEVRSMQRTVHLMHDDHLLVASLSEKVAALEADKTPSLIEKVSEDTPETAPASTGFLSGLLGRRKS